jgi:hypothetical protein
MDNLEKIKDKLIKLKELAERGYQGEAIAAKEALDRLLKKYNLTMESLGAEEKKWYWIKTGRKEYKRKLLFQCYYNVFDLREATYKRYKDEIGFKITTYEYAELINAYEWHKANFEKELKRTEKDLFSAYCYKHDIYPQTDNDDDDDGEDNDSSLDLESINRILTLAGNLDNVTYRKQLSS